MQENNQVNHYDFNRPREASLPWARLVARGVMRALAPRWSVSGRQNIIWRRPVIFAPNHLSDADPLVVLVAMRRIAWYMAKRELFDDWPIIRPVLRWGLAYPVEPETSDRVALHFSEELLKRGEALVVFPEGHCSKTGELQPLQPGAALLALRGKVPIIPVGLYNTNAIIPIGQIVPRPTLEPVHIHFGKPLDFSPLSSLPRRDQRKIATQQLSAALAQAVQTARQKAR